MSDLHFIKVSLAEVWEEVEIRDKNARSIM